jgi:putative endonuclease
VSADSTRKKGSKGEELAGKYLKSKGYSILEKNFSLKTGEIDIIARDGDTIVFVEVKTATSTSFGDPLEWVPVQKQRRIIKTSLSYLTRHGLHDSPVRFDVVAIDPSRNINHVRDAFIPQDHFPV